MKTLLVLDMWRGAAGGAGKSALYAELGKLITLEFLHVPLPRYVRWKTIATTFHPNPNNWKRRKSHREETLQKYPSTFRLTTRQYNGALGRYSRDYDAILQIGSLFGPVNNPRAVPYFSYSDSTVRNADLLCKEWMPTDFDAFRSEWYALERNYFQSVSKALVYSGYVKRTLEEEYGLPSAKVAVVGSALKIPKEYPIDWSQRKNTILFVSTDFRLKGGYKLPRILATVAESVPDATLTIVGSN
jgi:glycosyltransferase involved in cell wall biosynthesis